MSADVGDSHSFQRFALALAVGICLLLGACGKRQQSAHGTSSAAARPPMAQSDSGEFHYDDPCSLLTAAEVEAAFGARLGTAPYRGTAINPEPDGSDCVYQTANFQTVTLSVSFDGGQQAYHIGDIVSTLVKGASPGVVAGSAKKAMISEDGSEIAGEWDSQENRPEREQQHVVDAGAVLGSDEGAGGVGEVVR